MRISVSFYSHLREVTGCAQTSETVPDGATLDDLWRQLAVRFPQLADWERSTLIAVGVDYQPRSCRLKEGDEVALFPPVQGG
jgi:molybdopterin converting factor small subunit